MLSDMEAISMLGGMAVLAALCIITLVWTNIR